MTPLVSVVMAAKNYARFLPAAVESVFAQTAADWELVIVRRPDGKKGWVKLPLRWTVERTFAWLGKCRRLSKDREKSVPSSEEPEPRDLAFFDQVQEELREYGLGFEYQVWKPSGG